MSIFPQHSAPCSLFKNNFSYFSRKADATLWNVDPSPLHSVTLTLLWKYTPPHMDSPSPVRPPPRTSSGPPRVATTLLKPSLVTLCLPPALIGQAVAKFSISLSPSHGQHPWNPFASVHWLAVSSTRTQRARGRGLALHPLLCPQCLAPTRQVCAEWTGIFCLWESCFPWSPPGQGPGGSGPTFAPGASMLHATECGTNSGTCRLGWVTPGQVPCNPGRALGRARSMFLSFALEPLQLWLEPPPPRLSTPGDSHALAPTQVRAPVFTPEPLLLSVRWALPPPLCHL